MDISAHPNLDGNKIHLDNRSCVRHWTKKLGKSKDEIAAAIEKVGNNCESVSRELGLSDAEAPCK